VHFGEHFFGERLRNSRRDLIDLGLGERDNRDELEEVGFDAGFL
jgi:hypothetical protein